MKTEKQNKTAIFTIADENNLKYAEMLEKSLRKFHSKEEVDFVLVGTERLDSLLQNDPKFFYRATPIIGKELIREYDTVIKLDADQIIVGDISHLWELDYDLAVVNNSNPKELKKLPVSVWNVNPLSYVNAGFVGMKSKEFIDHWLYLCKSPHFDYPAYQYKEQDLLNILVFYGNYKVTFLDASPKWHGLIFKGYEPHVILKDDKLILPKDGTWPKDGDKEIVCWHVAGGNQPNKMNYKVRFKPEVAEFIDKLVK